MLCFCRLQEIDAGSPHTADNVLGLLGNAWQLLRMRTACTTPFLHFCMHRLSRYLKELPAPGGHTAAACDCVVLLQECLCKEHCNAGGPSEPDEEEADKEDVEGAMSQCLYALYGLDLDNRDPDWGGGLEVLLGVPVILAMQ